MDTLLFSTLSVRAGEVFLTWWIYKVYLVNRNLLMIHGEWQAIRYGPQ